MGFRAGKRAQKLCSWKEAEHLAVAKFKLFLWGRGHSENFGI